MTAGEVEILTRAHALFAGDGHPHALDAPADRPGPPADALPAAYRAAAVRRRDHLVEARRIDDQVSAILVDAHHDRQEGRRQTAAVLAAARADAATTPDNPIAHRELLRRRATRLRTQQAHILAARRRARRRLMLLRALRYRIRRQRPASPNSRAAVAVRAALSRLGCPYVWGATGPDRFDCSGLVKWAYAQAGVHLDRTTYDQIDDGLPIARSQVRPGDLVFPNPGHVQMAIGNGLVVEAPHAGANVRISRLGPDAVIRRPT